MLNAGFYPFWFWNDLLCEDEIRWQIDAMAQEGLKGFLIHSRQGLRTPYMSDAFMSMVESAVEQAQRHGMTVHLYDEYPYPSGVAGGEVVAGQPRFYATRLGHESFDVEGGYVKRVLPEGKVLHCRAYPMTGERVEWQDGIDLLDHVGMVLTEESFSLGGLSDYNRKRYFASRPRATLDVNLPKRRFRICVSFQTVPSHHKYWGHFVDELNPQAIGEFIRLTHERYRRRLGRHFGKTILSVYTDEISPCWSQDLPAEFMKRHGYDLIEFMPAVSQPSHPKHAKVNADLNEILREMFIRSFEEPVRDWCHQNNLLYTGEKPIMRMSQLKYMDIPGCDAAHTKAGGRIDLLRPLPRSNARVAASGAYWYDKSGALCECFHSLGWGATLQDARWLVDGLWLLGVKYLVPHGAFYSAHSLRKHDAPPSFFFQMPYWEKFHLLSDRVNRLDRLFAGSRPNADVLVYEPSSGVGDRSMRETFEQLNHALMGLHVDYLYVDLDVLEGGEISGPRVRIKDVATNVVILPPMLHVEEALQRWIEQFSDAGGTVLRCDSQDDIPAILDATSQSVQPALKISTDDGRASDVWAGGRVFDDKRGWLVLNLSPRRIEATFEAGGKLVERPIQNSLTSALKSIDKNVFSRTIEPFESFWIETSAQIDHSARPAEVAISTGGEWLVTPKNANVLRLNQWEMTLGDGGEGAIVTPSPLSNQLEEGKLAFVPAAIRRFGAVPSIDFGEMTVHYQTRFTCDYNRPVKLVMEADSLGGEWVIEINERGSLSADDFVPTDMHMRRSFGTDITNMLTKGVNTIRVTVKVNRHDGGLRNPLYLCGDFGTFRDDATGLEGIVLWPGRGEFEAYRANGLAYYCGLVEYERQVELAGVEEGPRLLRLDVPEGFEDACDISINGGDWLTMPWSPRLVEVGSDMLRRGVNKVKIRVFTTRIRSFEGQWFDAGEHVYKDVWSGR